MQRKNEQLRSQAWIWGLKPPSSQLKLPQSAWPHLAVVALVKEKQLCDGYRLSRPKTDDRPPCLLSEVQFSRLFAKNELPPPKKKQISWLRPWKWVDLHQSCATGSGQPYAAALWKGPTVDREHAAVVRRPPPARCPIAWVGRWLSVRCSLIVAAAPCTGRLSAANERSIGCRSHCARATPGRKTLRQVGNRSAFTDRPAARCKVRGYRAYVTEWRVSGV